MILYSWRSRSFRNVHKKYEVGAGSGSSAAKTDTLTEAKQAGVVIAKKEAWRGKWNLLFLSIGIYKQDAPGSIFYKPTGWNMYVPVRGSGKSANYIVSAIKSRAGVAPFKWTKNGQRKGGS